MNYDQAGLVFGAFAIVAALLFWIVKAVASHAIGAAIWSGIKAGLGKKEKRDDKEK